MKDYERIILRDAIEVYCKKCKMSDEVKKSLYSDLSQTEAFWNNLYKNEFIADKLFSEHFWKVIEDNFTTGYVNCLKMRYINKMTYQEIGDANGYNKTCGEQKVKQLLIKLPKTKIWRVILFNEVYITPLKKTVPRDNIYATTLTNRCKTILINYCTDNNLEPTIGNIIANLSSVSELERIGFKTIKELFSWFNSNGYNEYVSIWKRTMPDKFL